MTKRLILHIGAPKCGSTYAQNLMLRNAPSLRAAGISYPKPISTHPGNGLSIIDLTEATLIGWFSQTDTVVLSHEDLFASAPQAKNLAQLTQDQNIQTHILCILRPFPDFIFGDLSQFMKQHFEVYLSSRQPYDGLTFPQFVQRRTQTLRPALFLRQWHKLFPQAVNISALRDLRKTLTNLLGRDAIENWTIPRDLTNPSLPMQACDDLAEMMRTGVPDTEIRRSFKAAFKPSAQPDLGRTNQRINLINRAFDTEIQALKRDFDFDMPS